MVQQSILLAFLAISCIKTTLCFQCHQVRTPRKWGTLNRAIGQVDSEPVDEKQNRDRVKQDTIVKDFENWAQNKNIKFDGLRHEQFEFLGSKIQGIKALGKVDAGKQLVQLPKKFTISTYVSEKCPFPGWISSSFWDKQPNYIRLALKLLWEKKLGENSAVQAYVDLLPDPENLDTLYYWTDEELDLLRYPVLKNSVLRQRKEWDELHKQLVSSSPGGAEGAPAPEELAWALGCVLSRAFAGARTGLQNRATLAVQLAALLAGAGLYVAQDSPWGLAAAAALALPGTLQEARTAMDPELQKSELVLLPMIDSINHQTTVETDLGFNPLTESFGISVKQSFETGEQVFISYGLKTNDELLQFFGFVEKQNPADVWAFALSDYVDPDRAELLRREGLGPFLRRLALGGGGGGGAEGAAVGPEARRALGLAAAADEALGRTGLEFHGGGDDDRQEREGTASLAGTALLRQALTESLAALEAPVSPGLAADPLRARLAAQFREEKAKAAHRVLAAL